jgi:hypothetical protein
VVFHTGLGLYSGIQLGNMTELPVLIFFPAHVMTPLSSPAQSGNVQRNRSPASSFTELAAGHWSTV